MSGSKYLSLEQQIEKWTYKDPNSGCWIWLGHISVQGYGKIRTEKFVGQRLAHRVIYQFYKGHVPKELTIDHLCRVRCCVNPFHMEPVTHLENMKRAIFVPEKKHKTICPKGHALTEDNLLINDKGHRRCRLCRILQQRAIRKRRKEQCASL